MTQAAGRLSLAGSWCNIKKKIKSNYLIYAKSTFSYYIFHNFGTIKDGSSVQWHDMNATCCLYVGNDTTSKNTYTQLWHMEDWWGLVMWHVINSSRSEQCQFNISLRVESLAFRLSSLCVCLMSSLLHFMSHHNNMFCKNWTVHLF